MKDHSDPNSENRGQPLKKEKTWQTASPAVSADSLTQKRQVPLGWAWDVTPRHLGEEGKAPSLG